MAIPGVIQPDILNVGGALRLRRYDGDHSFALAWYQDPETVYLVDGDPAPYTPERLDRMYAYLADRGSCTGSRSWRRAAGGPSGT